MPYPKPSWIAPPMPSNPTPACLNSLYQIPFCGHIQFDHHNFFYITQLAIVLNPVHLACTEGLLAAAMVAVSTYHPPTTTRPPFFKAHLLPIFERAWDQQQTYLHHKTTYNHQRMPQTYNKSKNINHASTILHATSPQSQMISQKSHIWHHHTQALPCLDFTGPQSIQFLFLLSAPQHAIQQLYFPRCDLL